MNSHVRIAAILQIALGIPGVLGALIVLAAVGGGGLLSFDPATIFVTSTVAVVLSTLILAVHIPGIIAGIFLLRGHDWARVVTLILAALELLNFPFGTALAVYTFWALTRPEESDSFSAIGTQVSA